MLSCLLLAGCGVKKKVQPAPVPAEPEVPAWHTCLIQGARATLRVNNDRIDATVTMQTVHDSMLVISVTPLLGMEMVRFEATPFELTGINKIDGTYATTTYTAVNKRLTPTVNWDVLQQLCTAELPTGSEQARLLYTLGDKTIELIVNYPARRLDVPVRVSRMNTSRYRKIDIEKWL